MNTSLQLKSQFWVSKCFNLASNLLQIMDFMNTDIDILLQKSASFTKTFQNVIWSISDDYNMFICVVETSGSHLRSPGAP